MKIDVTNWQARKLKDTELAAIYGVSRATIWRWAKAGTIPEPKKISANTSRWDGAELALSMSNNQ